MSTPVEPRPAAVERRTGSGEGDGRGVGIPIAHSADLSGATS